MISGAMIFLVSCNTSPNPFNEQAALDALGSQGKSMSEPEKQAYLARKRREHESANSIITPESYRPHSRTKRERMYDVTSPNMLREERERELNRKSDDGVMSFFNRNW